MIHRECYTNKKKPPTHIKQGNRSENEIAYNERRRRRRRRRKKEARSTLSLLRK
jgi:hypothetical protein